MELPRTNEPDHMRAALGALRVDEGKLKDHVDEVVSSVEETLNGLLDAEADQICRAQRHERSLERVDGRAGHCERKLETKAGEVTLRVPKLRRLPFETAIVERY
jgi:putative transposase